MGKKEDPTRTAERLEREKALLAAEVEALKWAAKRATSQQANAHHSLMAITGLFRVYTDDHGFLHQSQSWPYRMGALSEKAHIADLFGTDDARKYFDEVYDLRRRFQGISTEVDPKSWTCVFSSEKGIGPKLGDWISNNPDGWKIEGAGVTSILPDGGGELYLVSPRELIGPSADFRITYMARADEDVKDLSVGTGSEASFSMDHWQLLRPDAMGYGFIFGGMHNMSTELQRRLRKITAEEPNTLVNPGAEHHCVAQRIGGRLELIVDGQVVFSEVDTLPLMGGDGRGYVTLYTCGHAHRFWNISVHTRPTDLSPEKCRRIRDLERATFKVAEEESAFFEVLYAGPNCFILKDISLVVAERRKAEESRQILQQKLANAQRMESLGLLAGGVAHDLNNILNPVVALPKMVIDELRGLAFKHDIDTRQTIELLELVEESARRGADMIKDLLMLSRRGDYERSAVNINNIVQDYMDSPDFVDLKKKMPNVNVRIELDENAAALSGSESHLSRVVSNLAGNGLEAIAALTRGRTGMDNADIRGTLTLRTMREELKRAKMGFEYIEAGEYVKLEISDTGAGMEEKDIPRIFEPFFTKKKQTGRSGGGLGLAIVRGIIKDHKGFIDVESTPGKGTTFRLYFPCSKEEVLETQADNEVRGGNERILVVDDEPEQTITAKTILDSLGYSVISVSSGREAVRQIKNAFQSGFSFDLVLLDMIMEEDFDGLATYEEILTIFPEQKAIICSGHSQSNRAKAALELGGSWLAKPYDQKRLGLAVRERLDRKH